MALKFLDKLSKTLFLNDKDDYNVIIEVKNEEKSFSSHANILKYRSSYFRRELENIHPNENNIKTVIEPKISAQIFEIILKYIYGGIVNLENAETSLIFDLMLAINEFEFEEFTNELEIHLIDTKSSCIQILFLTQMTLLPESSLILDEQLWKYINNNLSSPKRQVKSIILPARNFSTIISGDHLAEISTSVVAKVKGTDEILGGYNPLSWNNNNIKDQWIETKDSFIFSLKNGNIQDSILSKTKNAILNIR
ncbi:hypothetical protein Glove_117g109 [Diversispora epigaea]|uniref:BTB domain-containing protein n=1 Tax=Diversispora epigaea TaxID=1348612 RepID=A0A397J0T2_9GLOM|nr:hypothetical protein Glove_117g109 [Diversispora epigaea]